VHRIHVLHRDLRPALLEEVLELVDQPHRVPRLPEVRRVQDDRLDVERAAQVRRPADLLERVRREDAAREQELRGVHRDDRQVVALGQSLELVRRLGLRALRHHHFDALGPRGFHDLERPLDLETPERAGGNGECGTRHRRSEGRGTPILPAGLVRT
jgi:hypothetical protein